MAWTVSHWHGNAAPVSPAIGPRHFWRKLVSQLFVRYRPERHYMRGPGPKWHEKHGLSGNRHGSTPAGW
jgi:hypothetical protein